MDPATKVILLLLCLAALYTLLVGITDYLDTRQKYADALFLENLAEGKPLMYEPMPGFNRAQAAYEAQEPPSGEGCICDEVFECDECGAEYAKAVAICSTIACGGLVEQVERNESHEGAERSCEEHGWCSGCSSRYCEDCNG